MLRIGIAGLGFMGMTHYLAYQKIRGVKVAAVCEQDPKRRAGDWRTIQGNFGPKGEQMDLSGVAQYATIEEMVADEKLDLIDICLPAVGHAQSTLTALKAGKHVFCEKPIALKLNDATRMVEAAEKAKRLLMIGHVLPFFPEYRFAYETIASGRYGAVLGGHFKRVISEPTWLPDFYNPEKIGGPMLDLHIHDAHFIRVICGMPKAVRSLGTLRGTVAERFTTQFVYDPPRMVTATSGVIGQQGRPFTHAYEIYLEKATLFFDYMALPTLGDVSVPVTVLLDNGKTLRPKLAGAGPTDAFLAELTEVVRCVKAGTPSPLLAGELARDALLICQKETESVSKGRAVSIERQR